MNGDNSGYDNSHRAFLQAFLSRSTLTLATAKPLLAAIQSIHEQRQILEQDVTEADFASYVNNLNSKISPFDLEIRSTFTQGTGERERVWALVNTTSDVATQLATLYTSDEISYIKRLLDAMFETNNTAIREICAVTNTQAFQLRNPSHDANRRRSQGNSLANGDENGASQARGQPLSGAQTEKVLDTLVSAGWFTRQRGFYLLAPRALLELRGWLLDTYNEPADEELGEEAVERVKLCEACRDIMTDGLRCRTRECNLRLHDACAASYFRSLRSQDCPKCGKKWTEDYFVGPRAAG